MCCVCRVSLLQLCTLCGCEALIIYTVCKPTGSCEGAISMYLTSSLASGRIKGDLGGLDGLSSRIWSLMIENENDSGLSVTCCCCCCLNNIQISPLRDQ